MNLKLPRAAFGAAVAVIGNIAIVQNAQADSSFREIATFILSKTHPDVDGQKIFYNQRTKVEEQSCNFRVTTTDKKTTFEAIDENNMMDSCACEFNIKGTVKADQGRLVFGNNYYPLPVDYLLKDIIRPTATRVEVVSDYTDCGGSSDSNPETNTPTPTPEPEQPTQGEGTGGCTSNCGGESETPNGDLGGGRPETPSQPETAPETPSAPSGGNAPPGPSFN